MQRETMLRWSAVHVLTKRRYDALLQLYGSLDETLPDIGPEMFAAMGMREDGIAVATERLASFDADIYERTLLKAGVTLISIEDDLYPPSLRTIPDPPVFLTFRGDVGCATKPVIGLVGTRNVSRYGTLMAERFTQEIVQAGFVTVSGLAAGIDGIVARQTLRCGGKTIACLGHGLGTIFPASHGVLAQDIVRSGGLLLSEFPYDYPGSIYTFPSRNRIIAALSKALVVVEAPEKSGSMITADLALEYGREVFAVPGQLLDPGYVGCNTLIAKGQAHLALSPQDVLQSFGVTPSAGGTPRRSYVPQSPHEELMLNTLTPLPQTADQLAQLSGIDVQSVNVALTMLELAGVARNMGGGWVLVN